MELKNRTVWDVRDSLEELTELAATAGGTVVGDGTQKLSSPVAATFIGSGKAREFSLHCQQEHVDTVIFDDELSPAQSRNLEKVFECKVLDRTALILDIFAQRAKTREGRLQVELAQLQHLLPRLTRYWAHLSRQKGGIGMRGEGETQLETDRRRVQDRIARIREELEDVRRSRSTQREGRQRTMWPLASIVGYTNAGKTTLFNALTGARSLAEDKLFATLDPTIRRLELPGKRMLLLSDTVGFIRKLPHRLVEAFKATLEEVVAADLLIHVVDVSHPLAEDQIRTVISVLEEIGAGRKPVMLVFNKIDRVNPDRLEQFRARYPDSVAVSALTGEGFDELAARLAARLQPERESVVLAFPHDKTSLIARLHQVGHVLERDYSGRMARFRARIPRHCLFEFSPYVVSDQS